MRLHATPCSRYGLPILLFHAVEKLLASEKELPAYCYWRGIDWVVEFVGGEGVGLLAGLENYSDAIAVGEVDSAAGKDGGGVELTNAGEANAGLDWLSGYGIQHRQHVGVGGGEVELIADENC